MELSIAGLVTAGTVLLALMIRNHHKRVTKKLSEIRKMLEGEVEELTSKVTDEDKDDVLFRK